MVRLYVREKVREKCFIIRGAIEGRRRVGSGFLATSEVVVTCWCEEYCKGADTLPPG